MRYRVVVFTVKQKFWGGLKNIEVANFVTDSFPLAATEMSKYKAAGYRVNFYDYTAFLGLTPDFIDHGSQPIVPNSRDLLDDELAEEEASIIDRINRSYGEVPF